MYYNRFRYYDPNGGAYISQDPIGLEGGNPNIYGYVLDTNVFVDFLGLASKTYKRERFYNKHQADFDKNEKLYGTGIAKSIRRKIWKNMHKKRPVTGRRPKKKFKPKGYDLKWQDKHTFANDFETKKIHLNYERKGINFNLEISYRFIDGEVKPKIFMGNNKLGDTMRDRVIKDSKEFMNQEENIEKLLEMIEDAKTSEFFKPEVDAKEMRKMKNFLTEQLKKIKAGG